MPLQYVDQNLFDSPAQVLVNTVNTVGVMGKGIALDYKKLYPDMYKEYREYCKAGSLVVGKLLLYKSEDKWILNFPTKQNWRSKSKIEYLEQGLQKFVETYSEKGIYSISFPQLGVGNGGLNWENQVKPLMEKYLADLPIMIFIHIYTGWQNEPEHTGTARELVKREICDISLTRFKSDVAKAFEDHELKINGKSVKIVDEPYDLPEDSMFLMVDGNDPEESYSLSQLDLIDMRNELMDFGKILDAQLPQTIVDKGDQNAFKELLSTIPYIELIPTTFIDGTKAQILTLKQSGMKQPEQGHQKTTKKEKVHEPIQLDIWRDE